MAEAQITFSVSSDQPPFIAPDAMNISEIVRVSRALQAALRSAEVLGYELDGLLGNLDEKLSHRAVADAMQLDAELVTEVRDGESSLTVLLVRYLEAADSSER